MQQQQCKFIKFSSLMEVLLGALFLVSLIGSTFERTVFIDQEQCRVDSNFAINRIHTVNRTDVLPHVGCSNSEFTLRKEDTVSNLFQWNSTMITPVKICGFATLDARNDCIDKNLELNIKFTDNKTSNYFFITYKQIVFVDFSTIHHSCITFSACTLWEKLRASKFESRIEDIMVEINVLSFGLLTTNKEDEKPSFGQVEELSFKKNRLGYVFSGASAVITPIETFQGDVQFDTNQMSLFHPRYIHQVLTHNNDPVLFSIYADYPTSAVASPEVQHQQLQVHMPLIDLLSAWHSYTFRYFIYKIKKEDTDGESSSSAHYPECTPLKHSENELLDVLQHSTLNEPVYVAVEALSRVDNLFEATSAVLLK